MITRYFNANVEDAVRIAAVTAATDERILEAPEASNREIATSDLPDDFSQWKRYTAHAYTESSVEVMSRDGE